MFTSAAPADLSLSTSLHDNVLVYSLVLFLSIDLRVPLNKIALTACTRCGHLRIVQHKLLQC